MEKWDTHFRQIIRKRIPEKVKHVEWMSGYTVTTANLPRNIQHQTVNNYKLYSILYSSTLYAYRYPRFPLYFCPPNPAALLRTSITSRSGVIALGWFLFPSILFKKIWPVREPGLFLWIFRQEKSTYVTRFVGKLSLAWKFFDFSTIKNFRSASNSDSIKIVGSNAIDIKLKLKNKISFMVFYILIFYILVISLSKTAFYNF